MSLSIEKFNILKKLKLPDYIIMYINSYTYEVQDNKLLEDIIHNYESKNLIFEIYNNIWIVYDEEDEYEDEDGEDEYKNWLINDLYNYSNDNKAIIRGFVDKFYNIFFRNKYLNTKSQVNNYIIKMEINQINIFWGLFNIKERNEFINLNIEKYNRFMNI